MLKNGNVREEKEQLTRATLYELTCNGLEGQIHNFFYGTALNQLIDVFCAGRFCVNTQLEPAAFFCRSDVDPADQRDRYFKIAT